MAFQSSEIQLLSFDLDDTLWSGPSVILQAEKAMLNWMNIHTPEVINRYSADQIRQKKHQFILNNPHLKNKISLAREYFLLELFSGFGYDNAKSKASECFQYFYQARQNVVLFDNVLSTLISLKQHFKLIAITNGNADIRLTGLNNHFEFCLKAEEFEQPKPHPEIFEAALNRINIPANRCLHIGDHPHHDMLGAYNMGIKTCWLKDGSREWDQSFTPDLEIRHVTELLALLGI